MGFARGGRVIYRAYTPIAVEEPTVNPRDTERLIRRTLDRRTFLRGALAASAGGAALYAVGCGSGDDDGSAGGSTMVAPTAPPVGTPGNTPGPDDIRLPMPDERAWKRAVSRFRS